MAVARAGTHRPNGRRGIGPAATCRASLAGLLVAVGLGITAGAAGAAPPSAPPGCTGTTTTFTQSTPVAIPDPGTVTSTIAVSGAGPFLADVDVKTFITHTYNSDLFVTLKSPAGTVVMLTSRNGGDRANVFNGTVWDDDANPGGDVPYVSNNGMVTDHVYINNTLASPLTPEEPLGAFIGENPNGTWTMTIYDFSSPDSGTLNSWSITTTTYPTAPTIATSSFTQPTDTLFFAFGDLTSTLVVSGAGPSIADLDLTTKLEHQDSWDLDVTLISPAGTIVTLTTDNGIDADQVFNGTVWNDDADPLGQDPFTVGPNPAIVTDHTYANLTVATPLTPEEPLAAFIGENPNGTWTMHLSDDTSGTGVGGMREWTLDFDTTVGCPAAVTINQKTVAPAQGDPTYSSPINFTAVFSTAVTGFSNADVTIGGTATFGTKTVVVTGGPSTYNVAVSGMTGTGTVVATIPLNVTDGWAASTSTDNSVQFKAATKPANFDGDTDSDVSVFRPSSSTWLVRNGATTSYGLTGDIPVPCDYDGNGTTDIAVFRPSNGGWYVNGQTTVFFGVNGDIPVPGDYNADGHCDAAVFRPAVGGWYVNGQATVFFGLNGDIPVPADYDGDGDTDVAVYRPSVGGWYRNGATTTFFGLNGDIPVPGDYNGNGSADVAIYRPAVGGWYVNGQTTQFLGLSTDIPVPGDYDGNNSTDRAVFRPSTGTWYGTGANPVSFGISGDRPLPLPAAIRQVFFP